MTSAEARQVRQALQSLQDRRDLHPLTWLALVEDTLGVILKGDSRLVDRFLKLKGRLAPEGEMDPSLKPDEVVAIDSEIRSIVRAAADSSTITTAQSAEVPGLEVEVERLIQKGYFQSWPFRTIAVVFGVLLFLVTGVSGWQLHTFVQAGMKAASDAQDSAKDASDKAAEAKHEVANKKAEFALYVLQGNQDLVKMRIDSATALDAVRRTAEDAVATHGKTGAEAVDGVARRGKDELEIQIRRLGGEIDERSKVMLKELAEQSAKDRATVAAGVQAAIRNLEQSRSVWIPVGVWAMTKWWLVVVATLLIAGLSLINSLARMFSAHRGGFYALLALDVAVIGGLVMVFVRL